MSYVPAPTLAKTVEDLRRWATLELQRVADSFRAAQTPTIPLLYDAPAKPVDGQLARADGTSWNPGSGRGIYCFDNGVWKFLG